MYSIKTDVLERTLYTCVYLLSAFYASVLQHLETRSVDLNGHEFLQLSMLFPSPTKSQSVKEHFAAGKRASWDTATVRLLRSR